jgi:SAM-dependent methyltransferase
MNFKGLVSKVCGVDPDPRVTANPYLDEGWTGVGEAIPYPDAHFDVVLADNVLEHLTKPSEVFAEVWRVLKPGGVFLAKTPNKWHYMPLIARATPPMLSISLSIACGAATTRIRFRPCIEVNTPREITRYAHEVGFRVKSITLIEGRPEYLRLMAPTYVLGLLYERLVNSLGFLSRFRVLLITVLEKPV